jgi:hypothetical protein
MVLPDEFVPQPSRCDAARAVAFCEREMMAMMVMYVDPTVDFVRAKLHIQELEAEAALERELHLARAVARQPEVHPSPMMKPSGRLLKPRGT